MVSIKFLKPTNRHLTIVPHYTKEEEAPTGILLPEDYKPSQERYILATVIDIASDCSSQIQKLKYDSAPEDCLVAVDSSMIQEVNIRGKRHHIVLENYIVGVMRS